MDGDEWQGWDSNVEDGVHMEKKWNALLTKNNLACHFSTALAILNLILQSWTDNVRSNQGAQLTSICLYII